MATVFIPTMLQTLTEGVKQVECEGRNVRQIINGLDELYPGFKDRLLEDGEIRSNLAVAIDGEVARMGMLGTSQRSQRGPLRPRHRRRPALGRYRGSWAHGAGR